jgi:hypothetical protein
MTEHPYTDLICTGPAVHWSSENHSVTEDVGGGGLDEGQNHGDGTR